jgi:hypothetical protein
VPGRAQYYFSGRLCLPVSQRRLSVVARREGPVRGGKRTEALQTGRPRAIRCPSKSSALQRIWLMPKKLKSAAAHIARRQGFLGQHQLPFLEAPSHVVSKSVWTKLLRWPFFIDAGGAIKRGHLLAYSVVVSGVERNREPSECPIFESNFGFEIINRQVADCSPSPSTNECAVTIRFAVPNRSNLFSRVNCRGSKHKLAEFKADALRLVRCRMLFSRASSDCDRNCKDDD